MSCINRVLPLSFKRMEFMKKIFLIAILALTAVVPSPVLAQQFTQSDLSGDWAVFLYGAYETKTEHMFGVCRVNSLGMITTGTNTYRGIDNAFRGGQLTMSSEGVVTGNIIIEAYRIEIEFLWSRMNQGKTEITGMVEGQWYAGLIRMVKANGTAANDAATE